MSFNAEKEISKLWQHLHAAQNEIGKTYYRWRQIAIELVGENIKPNDIAIKAAEVFGKDIGKSLLPRLNWLKGEEAFLLSLGKALAGFWVAEGGVADAEQGEKKGEVLIKCTRDPWPTFAKEFGVPMEEVALYREMLFKNILEDVSVFFNIKLNIEVLKAIPKGQGIWLIKLYKVE